MRTPEDVAADIISHLHIIDPDLSAAIGTPERKIIDAVSAVVSASYINAQLSSSIWDIDTKAGVELEEIVGLFGFGRRSGAPATGVLTLELQSPAPTDYAIPVGTIASTIASTTTPSVQYRTTQAGIISAGERFANVAAECVDDGAVGNTGAHTIVTLESWEAVAAVYNSAPFTGGVDSESDEELRERFKETFLRNLAGTEDYYAGLCLSHKNVSKVRVVGPVERNIEQLQAVLADDGKLAVQSDIEYSKFAWPRSVILSAADGTDDERWYVEGQAFTVDYAQPRIRVVCEQVDPALDEAHEFVHEGDIVTLEHEYCPVSSRNDPTNNLTNKVDIFVNGAEGTQVNERAVIRIRNIATDPGLQGKVFADDYGRTHTSGLLHVLGYGPVVSVPPQLTISDIVYRADSPDAPGDYVLVREQGVLAGSTSAVTGILFTGGSSPGDGTVTTVSYSYNRVPLVLDSLIGPNRQITTDVMVHEADVVPLGFNVIVQLERGYAQQAVRDECERLLTDWCAGLGFGSWIQFSDIHYVLRQAAGVDNARLKLEADAGPGGWGVETWSRNGRVLVSSSAADFRLADNQLAAFQRLNIVFRAENTFGRAG